jgi:2-polyprenyl-3-methyl-5-hydroxy-6-metoxy-1,4-benzoquinol methylase
MDPSYTSQYEQFEKQHWWFVARRGIIHDWMDRFAPKSGANGAVRWLDVGCGTGVLLESYPRIEQKVGVELDETCVARARSKGLAVYPSGREWTLSEHGKFNLITLCDVLEHLEREGPALEAMWESLEPGGVVLVTVPALMSLWSGHDVVNHHFRRYTKPSLLRVFERTRWDVMRVSYFSSLLLPFIWGARKWKNFRNGSGKDAGSDFKFGPGVVDGTLRRIFGAEKYLLRHGMLPLGSSLILVARKVEGVKS